MLIVQLSDLHLHEYPPTLTPAHCITLIESEISRLQRRREPLCVVVCGDLSYQGNPLIYDIARGFLVSLRERLGNRATLILCPGNHDCDENAPAGSEFAAFTSSASVLGQYAWFGNAIRVATRTAHGVDFVVANSTFHNDHLYGKVDTTQLEEHLIESARRRNRTVLILHHHLLPREARGRSAVWNADDVYRLVLEHEVPLILHGHIHEDAPRIANWRRGALIGAASLFSLGAENGFNIVRFGRSGARRLWVYRYNHLERRFDRKSVFVRPWR